MRGFLAVARREIVERRIVFAVSALAGLLPLAAVFLPAFKSHSPEDVRYAAACFFGVGLTGLLAITLGSTVISQELARGTLGFYFSKPIGGVAIWLGKMTAAILLCAASGIIVFLPTVLAGGGRLARSLVGDSLEFGPDEFRGRLPIAVLGFFLLVGVVGVSHAASLIFRSRSGWLVGDAIGTLLVLGTALATAHNLSVIEGISSLDIVVPIAVGAGVIAAILLLLAGAVGVCFGRSRIRREHAALTLTLWGCLLFAGAILTVASKWFVSPRVGDMTEFWAAEAAPSGDWLAVLGIARHRGLVCQFLFNTKTGASLRTGITIFDREPTPVSFSSDGRRAAWLWYSGPPERSEFEVVTVRLEKDAEKATRIPVSQSPDFYLSPNGSQLGLINQNLLAVLDLNSTRSQISIRVPSPVGYKEIAVGGYFLDENHLRLLARGQRSESEGPSTTIRLFDVDIAAKHLRETGQMQFQDTPYIVASPAGDRLVASDLRDRTLKVFDGETGRRVSEIAWVKGSTLRWHFLADGRLLVATSSQEGTILTILSPDGKAEKSVDLGAAGRLSFGGQPTASTLIVALASGKPGMWNDQEWSLALVDLENGQVRELTRGSLSLIGLGRTVWGDKAVVGAPGSVWASTFIDRRNGSLVNFDPLTDERRVILPSHAR